jgi:hypothetical protein
LKNSFWAYNGVAFEKKIVYLVPCTKVDGSDEVQALKEPPKREDIHKYEFWILGGQHTIMAYKELIEDISLDNHFRDALKTLSAVIFWAPPTIQGNLRLMNLSKALNDMNEVRLGEGQFLLIARQVRSIWKSMGGPTKSTHQQRGSNWKVYT